MEIIVYNHVSIFSRSFYHLEFHPKDPVAALSTKEVLELDPWATDRKINCIRWNKEV